MVEGPQRTTFMTVAEVAAMLRVSRMTVYRWVHAGEMPAVRFGKSFRVPRAAVETFLDDADFTSRIGLDDDGHSAGAVG